MQKLHALGIQGKMLNWIRNFLSGRLQMVRVNDSCSDWVSVTSGVPQGSVLGPVLFLIYINDLPDVVESHMIELFADDAKLAKDIVSEEDAEGLQQSIYKVLEWSKANGLKLNSSKCKVLHLHRNPSPKRHVYLLDDKVELDTVEFEKDLGVYMDERLSFETHILKSVSRANRMTGIIHRNFKIMGEKVFINLYKTLVRAHLEYGSPVWNPNTVRDKIRLESIQRRATKLVKNITDLSYEQRLRKLGIPTLQYRRERADMIQVYKILHGFDRIDPSMFFEMADLSRTRGHKYKIAKQRNRTSFRSNSFSSRVVDTWNALPEHVVDAQNINTFKSRLNSVWKNHPQKFSPSFY